MTSKPNIQATTRELKLQAQGLMKRIKAMQESVHKELTDIRRVENELLEKEKAEQARLKALSEESVSSARMSAYVMPDEPEAVKNLEPKPEPAAAAQPVKKEEPQQSRPVEAVRTPAAVRPAAPVQPARPVQPQRPQQAYQRPAGQTPQRPMQQGNRPMGQNGPRPAGQGGPQRPMQRPPFQRQGQGPGQYGGPNRGPRFGGGGFDKDENPQQRFAKPAPRKPSPTGIPPIAAAKDRTPVHEPPKPAYTKNYDNDRRSKNKKSAIKETPPSYASDEERMGSKKRGGKRQIIEIKRPEPVVITNIIATHDTMTVKELSEKIGKPAAEIIKKLFVLGTMATINQEIDYDTIELICSDYNITVEKNIAKTSEEIMLESADEVDEEEALITRPPIVTVMGHVDHGKTSLLDAIRNTQVTAGEAGGITQHIGAYTVNLNGRIITFLDTPGHEAFTSMRARGAQATDIAVLVVAADDGIMPQTVEAINHAKAADVPIIVAINKIDKPGANPDKVMQQLTEHGLLVEEWGGDVIAVPVSAKTGMNLDKLLEMILLVADVQELKANPERLAKGIIIEAQLDKGKGPVATVLIQNGTLHVGDTVVAGTAYGRVRAMVNDKNERVTEAMPGYPVEVLGFNDVPEAGDILNAVDGDKFSRSVAEERKDRIKAARMQTMAKVSLDDLFAQIAEGNIKELNLIIKADVQGSVEAVRQSMEKISNEEVRVRCIHGGVGAITEYDVMLASASNAIIIGFNVRPDVKAREAAEREKVDMRLYRVIYNAIEDIQNAIKGMLAPQFVENALGEATVRSTFKVTGIGTIAGAYVTDGKVQRNAQIRVVRDGIVVHEGKISSLKRFKDDAKEVAKGYECGIGLENYNDIKEGDVFECFVMDEVAR